MGTKNSPPDASYFLLIQKTLPGSLLQHADRPHLQTNAEPRTSRDRGAAAPPAATQLHPLALGSTGDFQATMLYNLVTIRKHEMKYIK